MGIDLPNVNIVGVKYVIAIITWVKFAPELCEMK